MAGRIVATIFPLALLLLALQAGPWLRVGDLGVAAREVLDGPIPARLVAVIDGATIAVEARVWLGQKLTIKVRLQGIDAPELKGRCERERSLAVRARDLVSQRIGSGQVRLADVRSGKFAGRVVARVITAAGADVGQELLAAGLAIPYRGGVRQSWCS
ncbi:MAG: thermonuclease family protein [Alphaproteobacteria bacterium]|nr:thermonuclease family protein [Alphaproteobacteria bacterium]